MYKRILQVDKLVDSGSKKTLLDQNFSFMWSTKSSDMNQKQKNFGQTHTHVGIFKKAQEVRIPLCPSKREKLGLYMKE